ncbi:MAG TPA: hypothetical protein VGI39_26870 [Polyangiaceae bacterium]|jgi:hypothetical protein
MKRAIFAAPFAATLGLFVYGAAFAAPASPPAADRGAHLATSLADALAAASPGADAGPGYSWPIPANWYPDGYSFPLPWAPSIPYSGQEILQQAPGFGDTTSAEFWSYTYAWWLEGDPNLTASALSTDLLAYYRGLMGGCTYADGPCDLGNYKAHVTELAGTEGRRAVKVFGGDVQLYDEFFTGKLMTLHLLASTYDCPRDGHRVVLFSASPEPLTNGVWEELLERQAAFRCE